MGYTHYWYRPAILPLKKWRNWTKELQPLIKEEGKVLSDVFIGEDEVYFNGLPPCETFFIARNELNDGAPIRATVPKKNGEWFSFCKTRQLPYDLYVVKALALAEKHFGELITVESDGNFPHYISDTPLDGRGVGGHP